MKNKLMRNAGKMLVALALLFGLAVSAMALEEGGLLIHFNIWTPSPGSCAGGLSCAQWISSSGLVTYCCVDESAMGTSDFDACVEWMGEEVIEITSRDHMLD